MSVDEYRKLEPRDWYVNEAKCHKLADAAIAELEADLNLLRNTDASRFAVAMHERAEQAEADRELLVEWIVTQYDVPEENVRTLLAEWSRDD